MTQTRQPDRQQHSQENAAAPVWTAKDWWLPVVNAVIVAAVYLLFNDKLPDRVAAHFNLQGEANRYMAKGTFWLTYAALTIALPVVITIFRSIDPRKANYVQFAPYYRLMRWVISLFLQVLFISIVLHESGSSIALHNVILGALGVMWVLLGNQLGRVKSNFFIGIRTPWALSDDANWKQTHRFAAKLWFFAGVVMFALAWFVPAQWAIMAAVVCILGSSLASVLYSYLFFRRKIG